MILLCLKFCGLLETQKFNLSVHLAQVRCYSTMWPLPHVSYLNAIHVRIIILRGEREKRHDIVFIFIDSRVPEHTFLSSQPIAQSSGEAQPRFSRKDITSSS